MPLTTDLVSNKVASTNAIPDQRSNSRSVSRLVSPSFFTCLRIAAYSASVNGTVREPFSTSGRLRCFAGLDATQVWASQNLKNCFTELTNTADVESPKVQVCRQSCRSVGVMSRTGV